ncbi:MAG TPA: DUF397 domain-containing protein [Actinophytocola sp.]|nr:DUF397 domain-containing protein [Actinophytocola sp.]HEV2779233.1 DUF397 domain-containing protein [Actinophytocola sp.]
MGVRWRKSSYSGGDPNDCVEIADTLGAVRDSKNATGPVLRADLRGLLKAVKEGQFDR